MKHDVKLIPAARREFDEAADWYESRHRGLGVDFVACVSEALERISDLPESFPKVHGDIRRAVVRRFPYLIHFVLETDRIVVLAIMHGRREPDRWRNRSS